MRARNTRVFRKPFHRQPVEPVNQRRPQAKWLPLAQRVQDEPENLIGLLEAIRRFDASAFFCV
jgi:hypothetical protein